jgi:hypothetical protein
MNRLALFTILVIFICLFPCEVVYKSEINMNNNMNKLDFEKISQLIKTINQNPDMLHLDFTPSVHKLSEYGLNAVTAILPLLDSESFWERFRAQRVLEGVIQRRYGWKSGQGYPPGSNGEEKVRVLLHEMGNYHADTSKEVRAISINKWKNWLQTQMNEDEKG